MKVLSVNVSLPQDCEFDGQTVRTAIFKRPVAGRVALGETHFEGDGQANLAVHGGIHKAVYAYSHDHYAWWAETLQRNDLAFGQFGENLTLSQMDDREISIGDRFRIGTSLLVVSGPRIPCAKLGVRFGDKSMQRRFTEAARPGFYLRVLETGTIASGDEVDTAQRGTDSVNVTEMFQAYCNSRLDGSRHILERALTLPDLDPEFIPNIHKRLHALGA